jgi:uncharacterized protein (UPF0332 family)
MPFSWVDYLDLATRLAGEADEAAKRTAISRAYYAAFNQADAWLQARRPPPPGGGASHERVWAEFRSGSDAAQRIAIDGERLKLRRVQADYRIPYRGDLNGEAGMAIQISRKLSRALQALKSGDLP